MDQWRGHARKGGCIYIHIYIYILTRLHWRFAPCTLVLRVSHNLAVRAILFGLELRPATVEVCLDPTLGADTAMRRRERRRPRKIGKLSENLCPRTSNLDPLPSSLDPWPLNLDPQTSNHDLLGKCTESQVRNGFLEILWRTQDSGQLGVRRRRTPSGLFWGSFGPSWNPLGPSWGLLGSFWGAWAL